MFLPTCVNVHCCSREVLVGTGEENVTMRNDTRYSHESILVHEFSHCVMNLGMTATQKAAVSQAYKQAKEQNLYDANCYMMVSSLDAWQKPHVWYANSYV